MSSANKPKTPSPHLPKIDDRQGLTHQAPSTPSYAHGSLPQHLSDRSTDDETTDVKTPTLQSDTPSETESPEQQNSAMALLPLFPNPHPPPSRSRISVVTPSTSASSSSSSSPSDDDDDGNDSPLPDLKIEDVKDSIKDLTDNLTELIEHPLMFSFHFK